MSAAGRDEAAAADEGVAGTGSFICGADASVTTAADIDSIVALTASCAAAGLEHVSTAMSAATHPDEAKRTMTNLRPGAGTPDVDARPALSPNASSSSRFATESKESLWERYFAAAIAANDCRTVINAGATSAAK